MVHQWQVIDLFCHKTTDMELKYSLKTCYTNTEQHKKGHILCGKQRKVLKTIACPFTEKQKLYIKRHEKYYDTFKDDAYI